VSPADHGFLVFQTPSSQEENQFVAKDGSFSVSIDSAQLIASLFAMLPVPIAIVDESGRIVIANSYFNDVFPDIKVISEKHLYEITVSAGTFDLEILPLNDQGFRIVHGVDISKEVSLRRQLTEVQRPIVTRPRAAGAACCNMNDIVRSVVRVREAFTRPAKIAVSLELKSQLPSVKGDPQEIERVLTGLFSNAEKAISLGHGTFGAIHIRTSLDQEYVRVSVSHNTGGTTMRDMSAPGMDTAMERSGRGVYMARPGGLAVCAEIIQDYGGEMFCWSSYNAGSTYTFELPAVSPTQQQGF